MIKRLVRLVLDKAAARKAEREARRALERGTDPKKPTKNLKEVRGGFAKLKSAALAFGKVAVAAFAVKKVFDFGKAIFRVGADVRAVGSQFNTVFGEGAGTMSEFIGSFRRLAGLTTREAQRVAAGTGSMAQGFGMSQEASADFSKEVLSLSADLASFNNVPTAEAAQLIQSALIGNTEAARSLKINFTALDVQARALAMTGKESAKSLTQAEKATAALAVITERAGPMVGDLARTQNDADNQAKQLAGAFNELKDSLAEALVFGTEGNTIFGDLTGVIENLTGWVKENRFEISKVTRVIILGLRFLGREAAFVFKGMKTVAGGTFDAMQLWWASLRLSVARLLDDVSGMVNTTIQGLNLIPGVDIQFRMEGQDVESFERKRDQAWQDLKGSAVDYWDTIKEGWEGRMADGRQLVDLLRMEEEALDDVTAAEGRLADAREGREGQGGGGGAGGVLGTGMEITDPSKALTGMGPERAGDFLGQEDSPFIQAEENLQSFVETTSNRLALLREAVQANNPFMGLVDQTEATAAFMRDGFAGVGESIVQDLVAGRAELEFAAGLAALAAGIWPPNPAALASAGKHFAAAAAFRAVAAATAGGAATARGGGTAVPTGAGPASRPRVRDVPSQEVNIFIDPLSPGDDRFQRVVLATQQNAQERFGDNVQVNVRPRTMGG